MPEWGYWSFFFVVSLASLAAARRLDRGSTPGSGGISTRLPPPSATTSSLVPRSGPTAPPAEPLSVQVPL
ncbi:MAG: hypothetical protein IPL19_02985 [Sandaracinaceae bacterium]|nr:hypothetical protein [Sandaracinaceae bacterium]MBK8406931.1 hypothetical protein [Sandaracinaceae bacterium]